MTTEIALCAFALTLAGCGPGRSGVAYDVSNSVVVLRGQPSCNFRVLQEMELSTSRPATNGNLFAGMAQRLGAHAVIDFHEVSRSVDEAGRINGRVYGATAIRFSDPSDPECYRRV